MRMGFIAYRVGGDHGPDVRDTEPVAQLFGVIGLVGNKPPRRRDLFKHRNVHGDVGDSDRGRRKGERQMWLDGCSRLV